MSDKIEFNDHSKTTLYPRKMKNQLIGTAEKIAIVLVGGYTVAGFVFDMVPFPGNGLLGSPQIKNERILPKYVTGSGSDSNLPTLNRDIEMPTDKQTDFAKSLAASDGVIDKIERDTACAAAVDQKSKDALNEVLGKVRNKKIHGVRLSSTNLKGCSQGVE